MKRALEIISVVALAACLSACGGSNDNSSLSGNTPPAPPTPPTPPSGPVVAMLDAFGSYVLSLIGTTSETTQPVSIDAVPVTTPDNTQPAPVAP
jgi:hypothetical protein